MSIDSLGAYGLSSSYDTTSTSSSKKADELKTSLQNIDNATDEELMQILTEVI